MLLGRMLLQLMLMEMVGAGNYCADGNDAFAGNPCVPGNAGNNDEAGSTLGYLPLCGLHLKWYAPKSF